MVAVFPMFLGTETSKDEDDNDDDDVVVVVVDAIEDYAGRRSLLASLNVKLTFSCRRCTSN